MGWGQTTAATAPATTSSKTSRRGKPTLTTLCYQVQGCSNLLTPLSPSSPPLHSPTTAERFSWKMTAVVGALVLSDPQSRALAELREEIALLPPPVRAATEAHAATDADLVRYLRYQYFSVPKTLAMVQATARWRSQKPEVHFVPPAAAALAIIPSLP